MLLVPVAVAHHDGPGPYESPGPSPEIHFGAYGDPAAYMTSNIDFGEAMIGVVTGEAWSDTAGILRGQITNLGPNNLYLELGFGLKGVSPNKLCTVNLQAGNTWNYEAGQGSYTSPSTWTCTTQVPHTRFYARSSDSANEPLHILAEAMEAPIPPPVPDPDHDNDGHGTLHELTWGSNPFHDQSTPDSDDDGDGTTNRDEPILLVGHDWDVGTNAVCTGAYGVVLWMCGGYEAPPGATGPIAVYDDRVYAWDGACIGSTSGWYEECRTSNSYTYQDNITSRPAGYGWWQVTAVPILEPTSTDYVGLCDEPVTDADNDTIPAVHLCDRSLTVYPNGDAEDSETAWRESWGDGCECDPDDPINHTLIAELEQATKDVHNEYAGIAGALVNDTVNQTTDFISEIAGDVATLREAVNQTAEDALETDVEAYLADLHNRTDQHIGALQNQTQQWLQATDCIGDHTTDYTTIVRARLDAYIEDPSVESFDQLESATVTGAGTLAANAGTCYDALQFPGQVVETGINATRDALATGFQAARDAQDTLNATIALLGESGEYVNAALNATLAAAEQGTTTAVGFLDAMTTFLQAYAESQMEGGATGLLEQLDGSSSQPEPEPQAQQQTTDAGPDERGTAALSDLPWSLIVLVGGVLLAGFLYRRR